MSQKIGLLELLGKAIEGREALVSARTSFAPIGSRELPEFPRRVRPTIRLVALRDLADAPFHPR